MMMTGPFFGDGRRSSATGVNAILGLIIFGYPGFMYAVFGRLTWRPELECDQCSDDDDIDGDSC